MPDLTPAEQAIVDLVEREGPKTREKIASTCWPGISLAKAVAFTHALDSLLSRGLERERTVECPDCGGSGKGPQNGEWGALLTAAGMIPAECQVCKGTGSAKERVIGVRCVECDGEVWRLEYDSEENEYEESCPRCSSTPTPGLDPGSESEAR